jgi:hypothetical protein
MKVGSRLDAAQRFFSGALWSRACISEEQVSSMSPGSAQQR